MLNMQSLKAREVLQILFSHGFMKVRTSGSHIRLVKNNHFVTVPFHAGKTIPIGTLKSIIRQSGISQENFVKSGRKKK